MKTIYTETDLAKACVEYGMTLSDEERAGLRAYADNAPPQGSTLARLLAEERICDALNARSR